MRSHPFLFGTIVFGIAMGSFACNAPGASSVGGNQQGTGLASHPTLDPEKVQDELHGAWLSNCIPDRGGRSVGNYLEINGERFTKSVYSFSDSNCQEFDYKGPGLEGSFKVRRASALVDNAYELDIDGSDPVGNEVLVFDLLRLDADGKHLYFGQRPGNTESSRATELDLSTVYTRVE